MARSRRLGSVGEVSVWPDPALHKNQPVSVSETRFFCFFPFCARIWAGATSYWQNDHWSILQKGKCAREFVRARRGRGFFSTQRLQICEDWVLSTQSSPAVCAFGGWSRPEDGRVRRIFSARIWVGATRLGFSVHRDRGFVEIGLYLHRDCRCIGPCGAIIFSPRFARTRRVYVYVYTIEINISNIHHKLFEAWNCFSQKILILGS